MTEQSKPCNCEIVSAARRVWDAAQPLTDESGEPLFREGEVVICNPGADVVPGRYVVAVLTDEERAVFAKYRPAAHRQPRHFYLKPPNPDYPEIEVNGKTHKGFILARAIKHIRDI